MLQTDPPFTTLSFPGLSYISNGHPSTIPPQAQCNPQSDIQSPIFFSANLRPMSVHFPSSHHRSEPVPPPALTGQCCPQVLLRRSPKWSHSPESAEQVISQVSLFMPLPCGKLQLFLLHLSNCTSFFLQLLTTSKPYLYLSPRLFVLQSQSLIRVICTHYTFA